MNVLDEALQFYFKPIRVERKDQSRSLVKGGNKGTKGWVVKEDKIWDQQDTGNKWADRRGLALARSSAGLYIFAQRHD